MRFLKILLLVIGICSILFIHNAFAITILLEDTFDTENNGNPIWNYNNFSNWNVTRGAVDLIGPGYFDLLPGNGLYIDLDGSYGLVNQNNAIAGTMESKVAFSLSADTYELNFDLAGSQRIYPGINTVDVSLGSVYSEQFTLDWNVPFTTITRNITVSAPTVGNLTFAHSDGDWIGLLLDDVKLTKLDAAPIPEPSTMLLLGSGLAGFLGFRKKLKG